MISMLNRGLVDLVHECNLYAQGIINEVSSETTNKLIEIGSDIPSLTKEEMQERFEFSRVWISGELDETENQC